MDLAEIRKKARLQNASQKVATQDKGLPEPVNVEAGEVSPETPLENFWDSETGLAVTTEEEYAHNLLNYEHECEDNTVQWVTFFLGKEEYALELSVVLELIRPRHLTELPQVPDYLLGIVSLRGVMVPVIDLGCRLRLEAGNTDDQQRVIVCRSGEQCVGLLVDKVTQVVRINRDLVEPPPLFPAGSAQDFIAGVGRVQERMLVLLNPEKVMTIEPLESLLS